MTDTDVCDTLKLQLLNRRVDAIKDAISRARATWMFATLVTFIFATAMYNAICGYNATQLRVRAKIASAVSQPLPSVLAAAKRDPLLKSILLDGETYLGYLKELTPQNSNEKILNELRFAARRELQQRIRTQVLMDTLTVPLVGVSIATTDVGIVGGTALIVVGFWLLAALRRENHAFGEFIRRDPSKLCSYETDFSDYSMAESSYAYQSVCHYMIFGVSQKESVINFVTLWAFIVPPAMMCLNHITTAVMAGGGLEAVIDLNRS